MGRPVMIDVTKDILVYSSDEVAKWRSAQNHVVAYCLRDGKTLYERPCTNTLKA